MTRTLAIFLALLCLAGCGTTGYLPPVDPGPVTPWEPIPAPEPPVEDPDSPPVSGFDQITEGMLRADVEALLGQPSEDPPENPWEADLVRYDVVGEDGPGSWFIAYTDGRVSKVRYASVGVAR